MIEDEIDLSTRPDFPIKALPLIGMVSPHSIRIVVVFPAPFAPRKPKISPAAIDIVILSAATVLPNLLARSLRTIGVVSTDSPGWEAGC